jgi:hypothetical protein
MIPIKPTLGRLEKVDLRTYWLREDTEFTPWLASEENIGLLGDAIGIELEVEAREKAVGPFSADILCKDTATDNWVLIENQLERTDHIHLGQLLTYAAGLNAVTIVWIAARFTDEHRAALDWLNEITDEQVNFFGLEIELWKIGESAIAPKFNVVSKPNDWTKGSTAGGTKPFPTGTLTDAKQLQLEYWGAFRTYVLEHSSTIKPTKPLPQNWMNFAIGRTGFVLDAIASLWDNASSSYANNELRAELVLNDNNSKIYFELLIACRESIEADLGELLTWYSQPDVKACRIFVRRTANIRDRQAWPEQQEWLKSKLEGLYRVFKPIIMTLDPSAPLQEVTTEESL